MKPLSFKRHRFPADVIRHAVWLYFRFSLSLRDVEEILAVRGTEVSYETIQCWTRKFGPLIVRRLRKRRPAPSPRWHLDEMAYWIGGRRMYLWRAVDDEGEVLDLVVQRRRANEAAMKLLVRFQRNQPVEPEEITTDGLASYGSAMRELGLTHLNCPADCARTSGSRIPTCRSDDESDSSRGSNPRLPPRNSSPPRRDLQHLQPPAASDQPSPPPPLPRRGRYGMAAATA